MSYPLSDLACYLMVYSFLGWAVQVGLLALRNRTFENHGFLNLPVDLPYGITAVLLITALPTLQGRPVLQLLLCWLVFTAVRKLSETFVRGLRRRGGGEPKELPFKRSGAAGLLSAGGFLLCWPVVHPMIFSLIAPIPAGAKRLATILFALLVAADFFAVLRTLKTHTLSRRAARRQEGTTRLGDRIAEGIWARLERTYPGIREDSTQEQNYIFAGGLCFDKLVWVFLVSSFLGYLIETLYCGLAGGRWMNRSSLLYGGFSFVWGFGAVLLTILLRKLREKDSFRAFLSGFFIGGAYEYLCSLFTELVFGTVFWDYSEMPLNIGGRTNVLYCFFWGVLAVVWIKGIYPCMSNAIERLPALAGKVLTWAAVILLLCDGLLTGAAMIRYSQRQEESPPQTVIGTFLDERYDDDRMENRWPNMSAR